MEKNPLFSIFFKNIYKNVLFTINILIVNDLFLTYYLIFDVYFFFYIKNSMLIIVEKKNLDQLCLNVVIKLGLRNF